jgi:preprotein translocase subunit YajC
MLIPPAFAETSMNNSSSIMASIMPQALLIIGFIGLLYFFIVRPQAKRQEEKQALLSALRIGDVVYTNSGMVGKITKLQDDFCQIEVVANTRIYIQKEAVANLVPTGSLKALGFE